ncbi:MAG TPA: heparan-alpha-glucosaminide N-acetyltransferase domain-containing protein [Candidatus Didemnitutus sp.]|nr:heparan-alpha-glucosaminide N-acetyltransferase domain-containing protein [Candidatus Didemnitutus sp.]
MNQTTPAPETSAPRLLSLDALRGFDMFWILGADAVVHAFGKMGDTAPARILVGQVDHKLWDGLAFYDLIFPLFVFITGVSLVFSLSRTIEQLGAAAAAKRVVIRAALLFLLGILYNGGLEHAWPDVRLAGVLQRIAIAYAVAGLLFCFVRPRVRCGTGVALLALYWVLLTFVPIRAIPLTKDYLAAKLGTETPSAAQVRQLYDSTQATITGHYDPGLNLANHLDYLYLPGAKYDVYWDPEGLLSTLPAISTCLLGVMAGCWLRRADWNERQKLRRLLIAGALCLLIGYAWGLEFPIIKKIWTSSFVLVAGGWSLLLLGAFYFLVDLRQWRGWCEPFVWIGRNPITLYLATSLISFWGIAERLAGGSVAAWLDRHIATGAGRLGLALVSLGLMIALARFLYHRQIFLRV